MTEKRTFHLEHPIAQRLADLAGIANDLRLVIRSADIFLSSPTIGSEEAIVASKGIASFALITYFRTLGTGVRSGITIQQVRNLPDNLRAAHSRLKKVRDGYVAHSLNSLERNVVEVTIASDGIGIESLGTAHSRPATFSSEDMLALKALAEALSTVVEEESDIEWNRVWDFIESMPIHERGNALSAPLRYAASTNNMRSRRRLGG